MNDTKSKASQNIPAETRLFYGTTYSVGVVEEQNAFWVSISGLKSPIQETIKCSDIAFNPSEILERAHKYAQTFIMKRQFSEEF